MGCREEKEKRKGARREGGDGSYFFFAGSWLSVGVPPGRPHSGPARPVPRPQLGDL